MKKPKLMDKFAKEKDLEMHSRCLTLGGVEFIELRDYIPSTKTYSRGIVFERQHAGRVIEAIQAAK